MGSVRAVRYRPHVPGDAAMLPYSHNRLSGTFSFGCASPPVHTDTPEGLQRRFHYVHFPMTVFSHMQR